jgi:hypothetical protein
MQVIVTTSRVFRTVSARIINADLASLIGIAGYIYKPWQSTQIDMYVVCESNYVIDTGVREDDIRLEKKILKK